jgi:mycothiol synthase
VKVRPAQEDDVPEIFGLIDRHAQEVAGERETSEAEIRHWFTLPRIWIRVAERDGRIRGYLDSLRRNEESPNDIYLCALEADAAQALLAAAEEHAGNGVCHVFSQGADPVLPGVLEADGWQLVRHTFQMLIELDGELPEPVWPEGIAVRRFRPGEERRVYEANNAAFAEEWFFDPFPFEEWCELSVGRPAHDPELWWLAEAGEELAGFSLNRWNLSGNPEHGWVDSLGVLPGWRRRGLGEALLRHSFHDFRERGATRVGLGVDAQNETGAVRLYERVGMHVRRRGTTWEKAL